MYRITGTHLRGEYDFDVRIDDRRPDTGGRPSPLITSVTTTVSTSPADPNPRVDFELHLEPSETTTTLGDWSISASGEAGFPDGTVQKLSGGQDIIAHSRHHPHSIRLGSLRADERVSFLNARLSLNTR